LLRGYTHPPRALGNAGARPDLVPVRRDAQGRLRGPPPLLVPDLQGPPHLPLPAALLPRVLPAARPEHAALGAAADPRLRQRPLQQPVRSRQRPDRAARAARSPEAGTG